MPLYELEEGTSRKFYRIELHDTRVHLNWGRIGSEGQHQVLAHENVAAARAEYQRQIDRRLERGYRLVVDEGVPHDPEALEKARLARTGGLSESPRFLFVHRAKKRFAWVEARGKDVVFASGASADEATTKPTTKACTSPDAAVRERDKLVAKWMATGYELETFGAKAQKKRIKTELVFNEDLEHAVAEDPYDDAAWTVLEDWILQQPDPRAELVRLAKSKLFEEEVQMRDAAGPSLLGPKHISIMRAIRLSEWRAGYLVDCLFEETAAHTGSGKAGPRLEAFYQAPAARLMRRLDLRIAGIRRFEMHLAALAEAPCRKSLRDLRLVPGLGGSAPHPIDTKMFAVMPHLTTLHVALGGCELAGDAALDVRELAVSLDAPKVFDSWMTRRYPRLRKLLVNIEWLDRPESRDGIVKRFAPLFSAENTPVLESLEIHCQIRTTAQALFQALAKSDLRAQLRSVYIRRGLHVDAQVEDAAWPSS